MTNADITMERILVGFEPEPLAALRAEAAARGVSVSALVREAVDRALAAGDGAWGRALAHAGRYRSGRSDIAEKHDEYLGERW